MSSNAVQIQLVIDKIIGTYTENHFSLSNNKIDDTHNI